MWLRGSYKQPPTGVCASVLTVALIAVVLALLRARRAALLRSRRHALLAWIALMLLAWIALSRSATTWVDAKALVLTSPVVVLLAWAGVARARRAGAAPRAVARSRAAGAGAARRALARGAARRSPRCSRSRSLGGVLASDVAQYHSSNLAPTARYEELASIGDRFAGRGPTLFTDFDEYSMYALRHLDVGGPDFVYPPPALAALAGGYGRPVLLDRASPAALTAYPLIVTRRDPSASPPPAAYALPWQGDYYEVWARRAAARRRPSSTSPRADGQPLACARVRDVVRARARERLARRSARSCAELVRVQLARAKRPRGWGRERAGFAMRRAGTLSARFARAARAASGTCGCRGSSCRA